MVSCGNYQYSFWEGGPSVLLWVAEGLPKKAFFLPSFSLEGLLQSRRWTSVNSLTRKQAVVVMGNLQFADLFIQKDLLFETGLNLLLTGVWGKELTTAHEAAHPVWLNMWIYLPWKSGREVQPVLFLELMFWVSWIIYPYCFILCGHAFHTAVSMFFYISFRIGQPSLGGLEAIWSMWMGRQEDKLIFSLSAFPSMLGVVVLSTLSDKGRFQSISLVPCV